MQSWHLIILRKAVAPIVDVYHRISSMAANLRTQSRGQARVGRGTRSVKLVAPLMYLLDDIGVRWQDRNYDIMST